MALTSMDSHGIDWEEYSDHRTPGISIKKLLHRDHGRNFEFNLVRFDGRAFHAPRHRHNFDQIRIGLVGTTQYGPNQRLVSRVIGYFPEGTWYGPTVVEDESVQAILQLDGASDLGYISYVHHDAAVAELKSAGTFRDGYYYPDAGGERIDGYQAGWEKATGRAMEYPDARYGDPVYMHIDAFSWLDEADGSRRTWLGSFGERQTALEMTLVSPGATARFGDPDRDVLLFVFSGAVEVDAESRPTWSASLVEAAATADVRAVSETAEILAIHFPRLP